MLNTTQIGSTLLTNFSLAEYFTAVKPLAIFIVGIVAYSVFVFKFYKFLAKDDIIELDHKRYSKGLKGWVEKAARGFFYVLQNLVAIPILAFVWFGVMATFLLILSETHTPNTVILTSIATVAAVRITAYYNENLSQDLAKILPFTILGVFLVDTSLFSLSSLALIKTLPAFWKEIAYYLIFVIALEFVLLVLSWLGRLIGFKKEGKEESTED